MVSALEYECSELAVIADGDELIRGTGRVSQEANGGVEILVQSNEPFFTTLVKLQGRDVRVTGRTADGHHVSCDPAALLPSTTTLVRDRADKTQSDTVNTYLRLRPLHETLIEHSRGAATKVTITLVGATITGQPVSFDLGGVKAAVKANDAHGGAVVLEVEQSIDLQPVRDLLCLYMRTLVAPAKVDEFDGNTCIRTRLLNPFKTDCGYQNPISDADTTTIAGFLRAAFPAYQAAQPYNPATLIGYYWRLHTEQTHEIQLALAFILLEAFKFNWALNIGSRKSPPILADRKASGTVRGFYTNVNGRGKPVLISFEDLLKESAADVGVTTLDTSFIDERNSLFHTGLTTDWQTGAGRAFDVLRAELRKVMDAIDRILLTMLGYTGTVRYGGGDAFVLP